MLFHFVGVAESNPDRGKHSCKKFVEPSKPTLRVFTEGDDISDARLKLQRSTHATAQTASLK